MTGVVVDIFSERKKHTAMANTWGHLYPKPGSKHAGTIILAQGAYGDAIIIDTHFPTLNDSPQRHELEHTLLFGEWPTGVFRVDCALWFYKTSGDMFLGKGIGKVIKKQITQLVGELCEF